MVAHPHPGTAPELGDHGGDHEHAEAVGDRRVERPDLVEEAGDIEARDRAEDLARRFEVDPGVDRDQQHEEPDAHQRRGEEVPPEVLAAGLAPGDQRTDAHQHHQEQRRGHVDHVEDRRAHRHLAAVDRLGEDRERRQQEDAAGHADEDQVVEQEGRFPGDDRLEPGLRFEIGQAHDQQAQRTEEDERQEPGEPGSDIRRGEGVNRRDDAAAGQEGAEDRQREGQQDQQHVPDPEHVLLFLDHHRVQERGAGQPGHQRGVLHRIPGPVAAPAQLDVGPVGTEQHAGAQRGPGEQRPAPSGAEPDVAGAAGDQCGDGEGEGDRECDVADVQRRRVDHHPVVLELRVEADAVGAHRAGRERRLDEVQQGTEEDDGHAEDGDDPGHQGAVLVPVAPDRDRTHHSEHQQPQQQAAGLAAPERADLVRQRLGAARVVIDVVEPEVVAQETGDQADRRQRREDRRGADRPFRAALQTLGAPGDAEEGSRDGPAAGEESQQQAVVTDDNREVLHGPQFAAVSASDSSADSYLEGHLASSVCASKTSSGCRRPSTTTSALSTKVSGMIPW